MDDSHNGGKKYETYKAKKVENVVSSDQDVMLILSKYGSKKLADGELSKYDGGQGSRKEEGSPTNTQGEMSQIPVTHQEYSPSTKTYSNINTTNLVETKYAPDSSNKVTK